MRFIHFQVRFSICEECVLNRLFPGLFKLWRSPLLVDGVSRKPTAADATWSVQQRHTCHVSRAPDAVAVSYRSRFGTMMLKWAAVVSAVHMPMVKRLYNFGLLGYFFGGGGGSVAVHLY